MLDHLLAAVFAVGFPLVTGPVYLRRKPALLAGERIVRRREYIETILWLSVMGISTLAVWLGLGRDLAVLGLGVDPSWQFGASLGVAVLLGSALFLQVQRVRRDPATRAAVQKALEPVREFLPTSAEEAGLFRCVSVAAGVGEEVFYRGFLLWYLGGMVSLPLAVVASSALFGLAHFMHGTQATARATMMGFLFAGLYLFSGSLWAPILLHAAVDLSSGELGLAAFSESQVAI